MWAWFYSVISTRGCVTVAYSLPNHINVIKSRAGQSRRSALSITSARVRVLSSAKFQTLPQRSLYSLGHSVGRGGMPFFLLRVPFFHYAAHTRTPNLEFLAMPLVEGQLGLHQTLLRTVISVHSVKIPGLKSIG